MDTYIGQITVTNFDSSYEIKEYVLKILIDMGMAEIYADWFKAKGIHTLCTDQINILLYQHNAKPTYIMEFYSKTPLKPKSPTIYIFKGAIESIRSKFMHPDLYDYYEF